MSRRASRVLVWIGLGMLGVLALALVVPLVRREVRVCAQTIRVLFVGNSYTFTNDLPGVLRTLGNDASPRVCFETESSVRPGVGLDTHLASGEARRHIEGSRWDVVVLQDASLAPVQQPMRSMLDFRRIAQIVRGSRARPLAFETWARANDRSMREPIAHHFAEIATRLHFGIAPVGAAFDRVVDAHPDIALYRGDGSHPSDAGTFLAASVFYATLTRRAPEGYHLGILLSPRTMEQLQREAWSTVVNDPNAVVR